MKHNKPGIILRSKGCSPKFDAKLNTFDWLSDLPESEQECPFVEVQFKNTRKDYFKNTLNIPLAKGDVIAVESSPGHDIGTVTMTGRLVLLQMAKNRIKPDNPEIKRVYRIARPSDIERYEEAKSREHETMLRSREIAEGLMLNMKIGDVEFQGDGGKAIFYYIADERVDFRQLIKVLAEQFRVRIEMKQIGARQEAGRIGGIGPCGRQLCCSAFLTNFSSVSTSSARFQDVSLNPQKLAGQCAKLKCCFNYEVDVYVESLKRLPSREMVLETQEGSFYHFKSDILRGMITYSSDKNIPANLTTLTSDQAFRVIDMNKRGVRPIALIEEIESDDASRRDFYDGVGDESISRFDRAKKRTHGGRARGGRDNDAPSGRGADQRLSPPKIRTAETAVANAPAAPASERNNDRPRRDNNRRRGNRNRRPNDPNSDNKENPSA